MKQDGFAWWKQRFEQMSAYFDAFRIDHILGFFRIWSSPAHAIEGILGYLFPPSREARRVPAAWNSFRPGPFCETVHQRPGFANIFGADAGKVKREFLVPGPGGNYFLKLEFATQRQVENHFAKLESNAQNQKLKEGLFDLISNVILFDVEKSGGQEFHFRPAGDDRHIVLQESRPANTAETKRALCGLFLPAPGRFLDARSAAKASGAETRHHMLICGEDLGMVPACVPVLMKELGLLSLEIQRMPKAMGMEFSRPADAPYLSVVTPGTHDMSTIRGWWEENPKLTQKFFQLELKMSGDAPPHCETWINEAVVQQHLASPAMWSIFQLQDLLGMDEQLRRKDIDAERINVPANPKNYWHYRMHLTLEELLQADGFNSHLNKLILQNNR